LTAGNSQPVKTHSKTLNAHIVPFPEKTSNCDKPNLIDPLHRAGHPVHLGSEHDFLVTNICFGQSRYCSNMAALENFARIVGVKL
jgi:hypothetical protein